MADFGQFGDSRIQKDYDAAYAESRAFYGNAPRTITVKSCGAVATLDMDGCGYRCTDCFAVVGSVSCGCTNDDASDETN